MKPRLLLFAFGDFAFNLYWQSIMLFLVFYYTDALELGMEVAAMTFMAASIWDGIANFLAGIVADRRGTRGYGKVLMLGSVPLGLSFVLTYLPPPWEGAAGVAMVAGGHMLFRTVYALVNVPYLAMSARISADSGDRAFIAGMRMLFGTAAAVLVALGTVPIGGWLMGEGRAADAYLGTALLFAVAGAAILLLVGMTYREAVQPPAPTPLPVWTALASLMRNRAFVALNLAMMAFIVAVTVLNKSVLYYFKYRLGDESAGQLALASMMLVSGLAVPAWMLLRRWTGERTLWFIAAAIGMAGLAVFAAAEAQRSAAVQLFLIIMQVAIVGLNFVFWAMLPNTIEFGERSTGLRVEGLVFGAAALLQRIAIGVATAIFGWTLGAAGYVANAEQGAAAMAALRWTIALIPLGFLILSCLLMLLNPLGKGEHARIVEELRRRSA